MFDRAKEIEFHSNFNQTILPSVSILLSELYQSVQNEFTRGKIDRGFDVLENTRGAILGFLERDIITDKLPSHIEEDIFLPQIAGKLGRMIAFRPEYGISEDPKLLMFKIYLADATLWLMDSNFQSLPFQDKHKKNIGKLCEEGISAYLKNAGIDVVKKDETKIVLELEEKAETGEFDYTELADMALMSALASHFDSSNKSLLNESIRRITLKYSQTSYVFVSTVLRVLRSPLAEYFPIPTS